ncbi:hypothetical protein LTR78_008660 [Recurvomyces mirabilis]|uniref:Uncharacterized protein n=1 Tax=Recurvomyces mirabilis TaxID=574656 RepID=A0AAE0WFL7_9PEZI|nr:hypothetical protein LTR78_008660 [Recurvomyces mirabilis]KAK5159255.1 hypothetical protein LTS14_002397 [Recurvomyces mirabilis]
MGRAGRSPRHSTTHASMFSYPVTRRYPFRWITPVVIIGFVVATILFTFLNFVSTGYTLVNEESWNPNATVSSGVWMNHWPSFLVSKVEPSCEPINVQVGSEFFTNQTALRYTLTDVWQTSQGGAGAGNGVASSLTYFSNLIENCSVNSVEIDYAAMDRSASQFAYSEWGAVVRTYATCTILGSGGLTNFNITQEYDYVPSDISFSTLYTFLGTNFLSRNRTDKSSLWWGESLMSMYWTHSTYQMQTIRENQTTNDAPGIRKGTLYFYPNDDRTITNMTDPDFFECDYRFIIDKSQGAFDVVFPGTYGEYRSQTRLSTLVQQASYPNIWTEADALAKAAYSTVMTDLGQTSAKSNLLTDPASLSFFTTNFTEATRNIANAYPGPADRPYGTEDSGPLGTTPSVIKTKYLCQVPQRKPAGSLFVSILVADLVFLQALWFVFIYVVDMFFLRRHPERNHCEGCVVDARMRNLGPDTLPLTKEDAEVEMGGLRPRSSESRSRSVSRSRLMAQSMDMGNRDFYRP